VPPPGSENGDQNHIGALSQCTGFYTPSLKKPQLRSLQQIDLDGAIDRAVKGGTGCSRRDTTRCGKVRGHSFMTISWTPSSTVPARSAQYSAVPSPRRAAQRLRL